jgi:endonuclease/exonuclease/phosphatase family metal-dependent hydrolase
MWRPLAWLWGFNPLRRRLRIRMGTVSHTAPTKGLNLNVMSFNIRRGTARDGRNHWIFRRNRVREILNLYRPDVMGLQEALDFQIDEIRTMLPGYEKVGVGNMGGSKGLHTAIFYDAARFTLSEEGTFWLSDTPDVPGSRGWGNIIRRTCTWARLIERESQRAFYFYNTHLDHISPRSRKKGVVLLTQRIQARDYQDPFVLTGDFNSREKSAPIQYLKGSLSLGTKTRGKVSNPNPLVDTFRVRYPARKNVATYHGFRRFFIRLKLDYIFVPSTVQVQDAKIIQLHWKKCYASDHFPLVTNIALPDNSTASGTHSLRQKAMASFTMR